MKVMKAPVQPVVASVRKASAADVEMSVKHRLAAASKELRRGSATALGERCEEPLRLAHALERKVDVIDGTHRLTPEGRAEDRLEAARETRAAAKAWIEPILAGLDKHEKAELARAAEVSAPTRSDNLADRIEAALQRAEIRRSLPVGMDQLAVDALYRNGGPIVRAALDELPRVEVKNGVGVVKPYVSPELRQAILLDAAKTARPEIADALHDVEVTRSVCRGVHAALMRMCDLVAPPDPLHRDPRTGERFPA
jgi:hypothetical protein